MYFAYGIDDVSCRFPFSGGEVVSSGLHHCAFSAEHDRNGLHRHDCFEICIVLSGSGRFCQEGKTFEIEDGCVFVGEPYLAHEIIADREMGLTLAFLTLTFHGESGGGFFAGHETVARDCPHIAPYFYMITSYLYAGAQRAYEKLMELMVTDLLEALAKPALLRNREMGRITEYILERPGKRIYAAELAKLLGLSERGLYYYFAEKLETTPSEFVGRTRVGAACEYLQMGFTVTDACSACGFSDLSSFSRLFRRHKGVSPREYASRFLKNEKIIPNNLSASRA